MSNKVVEDQPVIWSWPVTSEPDMVVRCMVDYAFSIQTQGGFVIRIENVFIYTTAAGHVHGLDPAEDASLLGPALPIARSSVTAGFANNLGALHLDFADGSVLDISADEHYEAWTLNGPDGLLLVSTPGGGLTTWGLQTH